MTGQRYDRQLRLWGDHGQFSIEQAKICLIRASAIGSEILKNLVLPGVGSFTIVDDCVVCEEDLCNRPFRLLLALKVYCAMCTECLNVLVYNLNFRLLIRLSRLLQGYSIPIVVCISVGIIGYVRVSAQEHVIVESHPDSSKPDVRLDNPPEGLVSLANEQHLETMTSEQLCHTPWLIIVHLFVQQFIKQVILQFYHTPCLPLITHTHTPLSSRLF
ncbi:unnamed protein product [Echinostoma caproni]|uniref:ThiF domain-containing protein n=1 Tax=Echinostoma caproni TaxID=27848 RepID=A0A183B2P9_9TREM|nr:unnamed protein product [Echinostoma caproni]